MAHGSPLLAQSSPLIAQSLSLRDLAEQAGAVFHGVGPNPSSACPLHRGDNPTAFHLYAGGQRWHCFTRCPDGQNDGDIIAFYMRWKNLDFKTAITDLSSRAGLSPTLHLPVPVSPALPVAALPILNQKWLSRAQSFIDYTHAQLLNPTSGAPLRAYLYSERGLKPQAWDVFQLGYNPTDLYDDPARWGLNIDSSLNPTSVGLREKKVFIPRGLVIPGYFEGLPRYIKIRQPLPDDYLSEYLPPSQSSVRNQQSEINTQKSNIQRPTSKFLSVRGSHPALFGSDTWIDHSTLLLTEGEWDCMLAWQFAIELCDQGVFFNVATLGSASNRLAFPDLVALARYPRILAVYDLDPAGDKARQYLTPFTRIRLVTPPAHDLTDFFRSGGDLGDWLCRTVERLNILDLDPKSRLQPVPSNLQYPTSNF